MEVIPSKTIEEIILKQKEGRARCLASIIEAKSSKKIIIAGAGTGKTHTFKEVLKANPGGNNIAMTFIRMLTEDMGTSFGDLAEVKTFHAYCKKILHEQNGKVDLNPFLTKIIEEDSQILGLDLKEFDAKFQLLDEESPEIKFYLKRGDYYDTVSFNDSVYRLYKLLQTQPDIVPKFNQILIDEFQDFNALEVAFINEMEKKGNILIVGDDDQAVYNGRGASPDFLREKYNSGNYDRFELPFCSRCTQVVVDATNAFLENAEKKGFLKGRIKKRYECYIDSKGKDSSRFPRIIAAQLSTGTTIAKYLDRSIQKIEPEDINESWMEGSEYPTVLIVGQKQYLTIIQKELREKYPQIKYKVNEEKPLDVCEGYYLLMKNNDANFGWRILIDFYLRPESVKSIIEESEKDKRMVEILPADFIKSQKRAIEIISILKKGEEFTEALKEELKKIVTNYFEEIVERFSPKEKEVEPEIDKSQPSILLSSFVGCKGLSAGFVFIIGANDGSIPKDNKNISDAEISQFMVALTRTRKQCHIISNQWLIAPKLKGIFQPKFKKSPFLSWISSGLIDDKGLLKAKDLK